VAVIDELTKGDAWQRQTATNWRPAISAVTGVELEAQRIAVDRAGHRDAGDHARGDRTAAEIPTPSQAWSHSKQSWMRDAIWSPPGA